MGYLRFGLLSTTFLSSFLLAFPIFVWSRSETLGHCRLSSARLLILVHFLDLVLIRVHCFICSNLLGVSFLHGNKNCIIKMICVCSFHCDPSSFFSSPTFIPFSLASYSLSSLSCPSFSFIRLLCLSAVSNYCCLISLLIIIVILPVSCLYHCWGFLPSFL